MWMVRRVGKGDWDGPFSLDRSLLMSEHALTPQKSGLGSDAWALWELGRTPSDWQGWSPLSSSGSPRSSGRTRRRGRIGVCLDQSHSRPFPFSPWRSGSGARCACALRHVERGFAAHLAGRYLGGWRQSSASTWLPCHPTLSIILAVPRTTPWDASYSFGALLPTRTTLDPSSSCQDSPLLAR